MALKRIALISYFYTGILPYGGSVYIKKLLTAFSKDKSISIDFYCPQPTLKFQKIENINYIFIPIINLPLFRYFSFCYRTAKLIKKIGNYSIIHSNSGGGIFLKNIDIEVHHHYEPFSHKSLTQWISYQIYRFSLHKARHIISISSQSKDELIKLEKVNQNKITLIHQAINCSEFMPEGDKIKELSIMKNSNTKLLLYLGYLIPRKQPDLALETLKFIIDNGVPAKLIVIGFGPLKRVLKNQAKKLNVFDKIFFLDSVDMVAPYYRSADLLLATSKLEGFGLLYLEAPACGTLFIGFKTGVASLAATAGLGVIARDRQDFKQKSLELLKKKQKASRECYEFVKKNFSIEKWAEKMKNFYIKYLDARDK